LNPKHNNAFETKQQHRTQAERKIQRMGGVDYIPPQCIMNHACCILACLNSILSNG